MGLPAFGNPGPCSTIKSKFPFRSASLGSMSIYVIGVIFLHISFMTAIHALYIPMQSFTSLYIPKYRMDIWTLDLCYHDLVHKAYGLRPEGFRTVGFMGWVQGCRVTGLGLQGVGLRIGPGNMTPSRYPMMTTPCRIFGRHVEHAWE